MEAMRDAALAHYETLPDEEKVKIINDFKTVEDGGVSEYVKSRKKFESAIVECLKTLEGYKEERNLDFKDFITLNYVVGYTVVSKCDGCSALLLGKVFFSCEECFHDYSYDSYDLCCDCYRSRKFEDHHHDKFFNNLTMQHVSRRRFSQVVQRKNRLINRALSEFGKDFIKFGRSVITDREWENSFDSVLELKKDEKLDQMSLRMNNLILNVEEEKEEEDCITTGPMRRRVDLLGEVATTMLEVD